MSNGARSKTALVLAGGGSFGAIQAGMLHSLATHGIAADMVVGSMEEIDVDDLAPNGPTSLSG